MYKTKIEETLELLGINPKDEKGKLRSADELTEEVMALFEQYNGVGKAYILTMIKLSRMIDEDTHYLYPNRFNEEAVE